MLKRPGVYADARRYLFVHCPGTLELLFTAFGQMYSSNLRSRDRGGAIVATFAIQAALLFAFLNMAGRLNRSETQNPLHLINVSMLRPPPPIVDQPASKPRHKDGGSSSPSIRSNASAVFAPVPVISPAPRKTVAASITPRDATDPTQGAAEVRGTGTGAGGSGNGNGQGSGSGSGEGGGVVEPPHLATPVLTASDFDPAIMDQWPRGATIFLRLKINARGYVSECLVDRGTNVPAIDSAMCNMAHERLRFWPALNRDRQAVAGWFGYAQPAPR